MPVEKILWILKWDEQAVIKFSENLKLYQDWLKNDIDYTIPDNIQEWIDKIRNVAASFVTENINKSPPAIIIEQKTRIIWIMAFLSESHTYYSIRASQSLLYRRNIKASISISLRQIAKNFEEALNKKLTVSDSNNIADILVIEEANEEFRNQFIADSIQNTIYSWKELLKVLDDKLIELRYERRISEQNTN